MSACTRSISIEVFAASVVIWQLRGGSVARQCPALKAIAATFFILAADVSFEAVRDLITADKAGDSLIGIILNVVALGVMVPVALAQGRTGRALGNPVLVAQSKETWLSKLPLHHGARRPRAQQHRRLVVGRPRRRPRHRGRGHPRRNRGLERGIGGGDRGRPGSLPPRPDRTLSRAALTDQSKSSGASTSSHPPRRSACP